MILKKEQKEFIISHARANLPDEACGLLGGTREKNEAKVEKVYLLTNIDHSPEHFSMDTKEQFAAIKDMRKNGWQLLGNFHSHPASPSRPSDEDKKLAFDPEISYLILSLAEKEPVLKSFKIKNKLVQEEEIKIL